jgi:hypothetical protein
LLSTPEALGFPDDQHEAQRRQRTDSGMRHQSLRLGAPPDRSLQLVSERSGWHIDSARSFILPRVARPELDGSSIQ